MSFSRTIKEELSKMNNLANKESVKIEFAGYLISNNISIIKNKIKYATENEYNINRFSKLLNNLKIDYTIELQGKVYNIYFKKMNIEEVFYQNEQIYTMQVIQEKLKEEVLAKAFVRGAFLGGGSVNDPNHKYHFEIVLSNMKNAEMVLMVLKMFSIDVKLLKRKNATSVYCKDAEEISKLLAFLGASKAVLNFEEIRVVRDTRNNINRLVNCETANLNKTISAAVEQIQEINYLKEKKRFEELPDSLKEIANLRYENPDATLLELGQMLQSTLGKSGVNHRLKKICEIAVELRKANGEEK